MQNYDAVKRLVEQGDISITYIDHLPRTISHALARCLYEVHDVEINEPFFTSKNNGTEEGFVGFDPACALILNEYVRMRNSNPNKKPVTILVKDVAKSLPGRYWNEWLDLTENIITLVRDPHVQLYSLMEAIANDHSSPGEGRLTRDDILKCGKVIGRALRLNGTTHLNTTSWEPISKHLGALQDYLLCHPGKSHSIIDGNLLLLEPQSCLEALVSRLHHVSYNPKMLNDWPKSRSGFESDRDWGKSLVTTDAGNRNVWTNEAFDRDGFGSPSPEKATMHDFPEILQEHLKKVALPAYLDALRHPLRLGPKDVSGMITLLEKPIGKNDARFSEINPASAYAMMVCLNVPAQNFLDTAQRNSYLARLRQENQKHGATFDCIDQLANRIPRQTKGPGR